MTNSIANLVICGAGIAGISAAYHLTVRQGVRDVVLVDERAPMSLTSDKSTECYRNWWPGPGDGMVRLMNRSIDILEELARETDNCFHLSRRGYLFVTGDSARIPDFERAAEEPCALGAGELRIHKGDPGDPVYVPAPAQGFEGLPTGVDLILDPALIQTHFPFLTERAVAALHVRRCGWMSAQQLGMYMLEQAQACGAKLLNGRVEGVDARGGRVRAVRVSGEAGPQTIAADKFVIAAGPFTRQVGRMMGVDLPIFCELHPKIAFGDHLEAISRDAPLYYWADPQMLPWSEEERVVLSESAETRWLLEPFPPGPHGHPEGGRDSPIQLVLWTYDIERMKPVVPLPDFDPLYAEVVLRGLSRMAPSLRGYFDRLPKPMIDGGYYAKTQENRPLIGPLPVEGAYIIGALSGFGIMAACASGELLAAHVTGGRLPSYAHWFLLERYDDPEYQKLLEEWGESGQL
ncbi:MAG: FAD-dependent oxidoreductase [Chloroflexi bacterium]|nr:MAG: FAD-dependent oxidoreductase [Chloroflexota bacterium]RLC85558.1 MAG: FAD-dependent oxidoreductase [Chloroflexota bacterium]